MFSMVEFGRSRENQGAYCWVLFTRKIGRIHKIKNMAFVENPKNGKLRSIGNLGNLVMLKVEKDCT